MKRKDGKKKRVSKRVLPIYEFGLRENPKSKTYLNSSCFGKSNKKRWKIVSLFSGCGGLDLGFLGGFKYLKNTFKPHPFEVIRAVDNLQDAVECYDLNLGSHCRNVDLTTAEISTFPNADLLIGGFPCQDFSSSGPKSGLSGKRGELYKVLTDYMHTFQPTMVIAENVPYLARLNGGKYLTTILEDFESAGYHFDVWELYAPDYGLSQSRKRIFLVGVRNDIKGYPTMPKPKFSGKHLTISHALHDLEEITDETITNQSQFFISTKATAGGGQGDHKNDPNKVAYCIRANSRGRIQFHHKLDRRLTVRECARLQSFPDDFIFPFSTQRNLTLIGNAVPPVLAHHVANSIAHFLKFSFDMKSSDAEKKKYVQEKRNFQSQLELFNS